MAFCTKCGNSIAGGAKFCPKCGKPVGSPTRFAPPDPSAPVTAPKPASQPRVVPPLIPASAAAPPMQRTQSMTTQMARRLPLAALSFGASWGLHTWLMAVKNEGYNAGAPIGRWLNVTGNTTSSMIIWSAGSAILWSMIYGLMRGGPAGLIKGMTAAPKRIAAIFTSGSRQNRGAALLGGGVALLLTRFLPINGPASFSLGMI